MVTKTSVKAIVVIHKFNPYFPRTLITENSKYYAIFVSECNYKTKRRILNISIITAISAVGALNGFLVALLLIFRDRKSGVRLPLILYISILSIYVLGVSLKYLSPFDIIFKYIYFNDIMYGILLYMYIRNKIADKFIFLKRDFLYIIPIFLIYSGAHLLFLQNGNVVLKWIIELTVDLTFVCLALRLLTSQIKKQDSIIINRSFRNLKFIVIVCLIIDLIEVIIFGFYIVTNSEIYSHLCLNTLYAIAIYVIGCNELMSGVAANREPKTFNIVDKNIKDRLLFLMKTENLHRNKGIKLADIAERLDEKTSTVSYVINNEICKNFTDFINYYRIEEAKKILLENHDDLSIEGIGYEVGFRTKSTFYVSFKKFTGKTPAQY